MKIYFTTGPLSKREEDEISIYGFTPWVVDAKYGCIKNLRQLDMLLKLPDSDNIVVYTNALVALCSKYHWSDTLGAHNLYLKNITDKWLHIQSFTQRELRPDHNILRMFLANEFGTFDD